MDGLGYRVQELDESTWDAFAVLVMANGGIFGGCWCMGFHPEGLDRTSAEENYRRKRERVLAGTAHAALVFADDRCLGWAQFGPAEEVARIKNRPTYEKGRGEEPLPDWRIGCCFVGKGFRRQRVASAAIAGAVELIAARGGGVVEGYPEPAGEVAAGFLFHGALTTFDACGFERIRPIGKHRWVVRRTVAAA